MTPQEIEKFLATATKDNEVKNFYCKMVNSGSIIRSKTIQLEDSITWHHEFRDEEALTVWKTWFTKSAAFMPIHHHPNFKSLIKSEA